MRKIVPAPQPRIQRNSGSQTQDDANTRETMWPPECRIRTQGEAGETRVTLESINITNMGYNAKAILERKAGAVFFQEHKLKATAVPEMKQKFLKAGWTMLCGPCDETTKKPNAGAGVATRDGEDLVAVQATHNTKAFQDAWLAGRVGKYEINM